MLVLKPYQSRAVEFINENKNCGLFLFPGAGKTLCTLISLEALRLPTLIIGPLDVIRNTWNEEIDKWGFKFTYNILHGPKKRIDSSFIHLINPEGLPWLINNLSPSAPFRMLVLDESTLFKHHNTKRFKLLKTILPIFERRVLLTGSPTANGLMGLFSQIYTLDAGSRLGKNVTTFRGRYFVQSAYSHFVFDPKATANDEIHSAIKDIILSLNESEYSELPEITHNHIEVHLPKKAMDIYKTLAKNIVVKINEKELTAPEITTLIIKLRQISGGAVLVDGELEMVHEAKLNALEVLIDSLKGAPVIICYEFKSDLAAIRRRFNGDLPTIKEPDTIRKWNSGFIPILPLSPNSSAHGLNLQGGGSHMIFFTLGQSRERHEQVIKRIHRRGQSDRVFVHYLLAKGTIDEKILNALATKGDDQIKFLKLFDK